MSWKTDIQDAIRIGSQVDLPFGVLCTVLAVRIADLECDCSPVNGGPDIANVRLRPVKGTTGVYNIPTLESFVFVELIGDDNGYISMFSDVDKVLLSSDDYGGLVMVEELTEKLNNLENKVNSLISTHNANVTIFNGHTHPYMNATTPSTTSVTATLETSESGTLTPTNRADIESMVTFHGTGKE